MDKLTIRPVDLDDVLGISDVLQEIPAAGKRTRPSDPEFVATHYVGHPDQLTCVVAIRDKRILGFQSMKRAVADNPYGVQVGWGIIGTHIRPFAARCGVGRALFQATLKVAKAQGLPAIDATIAASNAEGLAYYTAIGFVDYRSHEGAVCKAYTVG
ncbi:putative acetyltransferase [Ruegeria denitrificans]|uniref:Putative acetyltransferase n=1 Tax=Ruegeria denitrificans TaxID=1715692 RepID=A0A0P1IG36_9RHOB|nr:GNAT family N-acetyltransferase [Ruegeria denitrificans]CUK11170.1 putative acetyltransferase [Ruegeria denitrificans]